MRVYSVDFHHIEPQPRMCVFDIERHLHLTQTERERSRMSWTRRSGLVKAAVRDSRRASPVHQKHFRDVDMRKARQCKWERNHDRPTLPC